ncbi:MAG: tRNA preQ1(34) S-adenosylmethionine ribosyltransferase-isomerase QueA [Actinomycetota bacterium]
MKAPTIERSSTAVFTSEFDFSLPEGRIGQQPVEPRHASALLDTRDLTDHRFLDLPGLLKTGDLVVVNGTRVRAARLLGSNARGTSVEALLLRRRDTDWEALVRPARRLRTGDELSFGPIGGVVVEPPRNGVAILRLKSTEGLEAALERWGKVPLPPYIRTELADPTRYQTMFATEVGSAAAPTAALHFTEAVAGGLAARGIELASVLLHIGLDTFRPIVTEEIADHQIHTEEYNVPASTVRAVDRCRQRRGRIVAVGTTVVRALETAGADGGMRPGSGITGLYITPGFEFNVVDLLVTNFHLPRTSLLVLLAGFMGDGWRLAYQTALDRGYRFGSFGDSMLADGSRR